MKIALEKSTMKIIRSEKHFFSSVTNLEDSNLFSYLNVHQPRQFVLLDEPVRLGFLNIQSDRVYGKNPIKQGFLKYLKSNFNKLRLLKY